MIGVHAGQVADPVPDDELDHADDTPEVGIIINLNHSGYPVIWEMGGFH